MAIFGSFTYGSGQVYGGQDSALAVTFISQNLIRVDFAALVVVDAALKDPTNYVIQFADGSGTDASVREVLEFQDGRVTTDHVLLLTDRHTRGNAYVLTVSNLRPTIGGVLPSATSSPRTNRRTKVDSVLASMPAVYDRRPGSIIAGILGAIGIEDERIGGAGNERV